MPDTPEVVSFECQLCHKPLLLRLPPENDEYRELFEKVARITVHNECKKAEQDRAIALKALNREMSRLQDWTKICPEEFRKEIRPGSRGFNRPRLDAVLVWEYGEKGLYIHGPSGLCKTRCMFQLLDRENKCGRTVGAWMHGNLRALFTAMASGDGNLNRFVDELLALDIVFIDDLGKGRQTPAAEEAFFALLDGRARKCRPTMFTSNLNPLAASRQFSEEFRDSFLRRLEDKTVTMEWK